MANRDVQMPLDDAVKEVINLLTGLSMTYEPELDRFQSITRHLNRALRQVALEHEWSYFSSTEDVGTCAQGTDSVDLSSNLRARIVSDDAVRLVNEAGAPVRWAYFLPRDAIHKYRSRAGLWVSVTRTTLLFSRPFTESEDGLQIVVPCMREPRMFDLAEGGEGVSNNTLRQLLDFDYPDLVIARAAYLYAQTDPILQPRVQTLEAVYKDLMYQLVERDDAFNDSPYSNEFIVPIQNSVRGSGTWPLAHPHPHSDERVS